MDAETIERVQFESALEASTRKMDAETIERVQFESALEALPDSILMHCILPLVDALSLGRVACCSRRLSDAAVVDHLWFPICRRMNWFLTQYDWRKLRQRTCKATAVPPAPEPWRSWHHLFSFKLNQRCVECRELTPYVYTLSNSRFSLCERCEHACPKYSLVTELEAKARYFLKDEDLQGLPHKKVCHKRFCIYFFLKTDVESMSLIKGVAVGCEGEDFKKGKEASHINEQKMHLITEGGELEEDQACMQMMTTTESNITIVYNTVKDLQLQTEVLTIKEPNNRPVNVYNGSGTSFDATCGDGHDKLEAMLGGNDACESTSKKELRKEHKRQVKAAKREKRNLCSTETTFLSSSPDSGRKNPQMSDNKKISKSKSTHMVFPSIQVHKGAVQSPLEPQSVKEKSKKMKWRTKREHIKICTYSQSETMDCNLKWKSKSPSDWVREREWLEVELGPYGLSALELQEL